MPIVVAEHDLIRRTGRTPRIFGPFSRLPFSAAPDSPHVPPQFSNPKTDTTRFAARTVPRFSEGPTRQASLRSIFGRIYRSSYHARGRYGSPRKPIYPIPFFYRTTAQNKHMSPVSRGFRRAPGKQEGRPTDVLLTYYRETVTRSRAIETPRLCQAEALIT